MFEHRKGKIQVCQRNVPLDEALAETLYAPESDVVPRTINREVVEEFVSRSIERFLLDFRPGSSLDDIAGYDNFVLGSVFSYEDEEDISIVISGYDTILLSTLMVICLTRIIHDEENPVYIGSAMRRHASLYGVGECEQKAFRLLMQGKGSEQVRERIHEKVLYIVDRYEDVACCLQSVACQSSLENDTLWMFLHWFLNKVYICEVTAFSDPGKRLLRAVDKAGWREPNVTIWQ